jgi:hypothetical protein
MGRYPSGDEALSHPITGIARCCARAASGQNGRAAQECDEVAPSHAELPVEDKVYQRVALCITAKIAQ